MSFEYSSFGGINYWHIPTWTERGVNHGWTDRTVNGTVDCSAFAEQFGFDRLVKLKQTHSTDILYAAEFLVENGVSGRDWLNPDDWPVGDGWLLDGERVTGSKAAFLVRTADCFPVIVVDSTLGTLLNLHCGWRGVVDGMLVRGLELLRATGSKLRDVEIGIGPGIRSCCFEIQTDTLEQVKAAGLSCGVTAVESGAEGGSCGDLPAILKGQAQSVGVLAESIFELPICTVCDHRFFSFRRNPEDLGRQVTFVGSTLKTGTGNQNQ